MDNMWNYMAGWPYSAMNNGGMNGPGYGDMPWDDQWMGIGPGPGPCPWDGYQPWMPPKKGMDCCAILQCIHQCMRHHMNHMPYEDPMASYGMGYGMGYGPAAGYGPGPGTPSVPVNE